MSFRRLLLVLLLLGSLGAWLVLTHIERTYRQQAENYSLIEEGLYMGGDLSEPPPGTTAVLNLCEKEDPYRCAVHVWKPTHDGEPAPDTDGLKEMVGFIEEQRRAGRTVYVHCRNGVSRSGMVVTAYLMDRNGWTRDEALAHVRTKRPIVRPNRAFMQRLLDWEQVVREAEKNPLDGPAGPLDR